MNVILEGLFGEESKLFLCNRTHHEFLQVLVIVNNYEFGTIVSFCLLCKENSFEVTAELFQLAGQCFKQQIKSWQRDETSYIPPGNHHYWFVIQLARAVLLVVS